jgi:hypothetical protein
MKQRLWERSHNSRGVGDRGVTDHFNGLGAACSTAPAERQASANGRRGAVRESFRTEGRAGVVGDRVADHPSPGPLSADLDSGMARFRKMFAAMPVRTANIIPKMGSAPMNPPGEPGLPG